MTTTSLCINPNPQYQSTTIPQQFFGTNKSMIKQYIQVYWSVFV